jgi:hypothetical protein
VSGSEPRIKRDKMGKSGLGLQKAKDKMEARFEIKV